MSWWIPALFGGLVGAALLVWGAAALWVRIISDRWNAMCSDEPQPPAARPPRTE